MIEFTGPKTLIYTSDISYAIVVTKFLRIFLSKAATNLKISDQKEQSECGAARLHDNWYPRTGQQNTSKPISEAKKHSIEEDLDSVTD